MTNFIKSGNTFRTANEAALDIHKKLPAENFLIKKDSNGNFYFEQVERFELPPKLYGTTRKHCTRILNTFESRSVSTGVMLAGEKGSGKSLLAKTISTNALAEGIPTIIINTPWCGDGFNRLIQEIEQPAIILFDEFEKVYNKEDQESILTLLDGVFTTKKLFLITCNDKWKIDKHMHNRPGRVYYFLEFKGLENDFIVEYCEENLINKSYIRQIASFTKFFAQFNFDMLKALVEEMNRYNESPEETLALLNVKAEYADKMRFNVELILADKPEEPIHQIMNINPLFESQFYIDIPSEANVDYNYVSFLREDLLGVDATIGSFVYKNEDGDVAKLTREIKTKFNVFNNLAF